MTQEKRKNKTQFLVLLALSHNDMHGYEIARFIEEKTKGFFSLPFGSLYPVLHRLEKEKLILAKWEKGETLKPKKIYSLSKRGEERLGEEVTYFEEQTLAFKSLMPVRG